jgi:hypothetical protein
MGGELSFRSDARNGRLLKFILSNGADGQGDGSGGVNDWIGTRTCPSCGNRSPSGQCRLMAQSDVSQRCKAMSDLGPTADMRRRYGLDGSVAFEPEATLGGEFCDFVFVNLGGPETTRLYVSRCRGNDNRMIRPSRRHSRENLPPSCPAMVARAS